MTELEQKELEFYQNLFTNMTYKSLIYYNDYPDESLHYFFILDYYKPFGKYAEILESFSEILREGLSNIMNNEDNVEFWTRYMKYKKERLLEIEKEIPEIQGMLSVYQRPYIQEYVRLQIEKMLSDYLKN